MNRTSASLTAMALHLRAIVRYRCWQVWLPSCAQRGLRTGASASKYLLAEHVPSYVLQARVVAVGVRDIGGVRQVGFFHAGGPIPGNPEFLLKTRPGRVLDPGRILVASGSNFGAPLGSTRHAAGSILSIDPQAANTVVVAHDFAANVTRTDGSGRSVNPALQLFSVQSPAYANRVYNRGRAHGR